jgi:asparagine synthase (glutamine-hydrolysing)
MSMAHGLEVRVPFLDHHLVKYVFGIPENFKIDGKMQKKILRDIVRDLLPGKLYRRPKHGFEVPLLNWFRNEMRSTLENDLLERSFLGDQKIFDVQGIERLKKQLFSSRPADSHAHIWALVVFQSWWKKYFS